MANTNKSNYRGINRAGHNVHTDRLRKKLAQQSYETKKLRKHLYKLKTKAGMITDKKSSKGLVKQSQNTLPMGLSVGEEHNEVEQEISPEITKKGVRQKTNRFTHIVEWQKREQQQRKEKKEQQKREIEQRKRDLVVREEERSKRRQHLLQKTIKGQPKLNNVMDDILNKLTKSK